MFLFLFKILINEMIKIFFNELLDNYQKNLLTQLRGFGKEQEYLKYWVPGVNKFTSLTNLIDALHESKILDFELVHAIFYLI